MCTHAQLHIEAYPRMSEEAIVHWEDGVPSIREFSGSRGAFRSSTGSAGTGIGVTLWESAEAIQASRDRAAELLAAGARVKRRVGTRVRGRRGRSTDASSHVEGAVRGIPS